MLFYYYPEKTETDSSGLQKQAELFAVKAEASSVFSSAIRLTPWHYAVVLQYLN